MNDSPRPSARAVPPLRKKGTSEPSLRRSEPGRRPWLTVPKVRSEPKSGSCVAAPTTQSHRHGYPLSQLNACLGLNAGGTGQCCSCLPDQVGISG